MGREVHRVPPTWQHPKEEKYDPFTRQARVDFIPLHMRCDGETAWAEWQGEYLKWLGGEFERVRNEYDKDDYPKDKPYTSFCRWHGTPPDPADYRPAWDESTATGWVVYETVSEGTPVTPVFATQEELVEYLATHGDFWDQRRGDGPWSRKNAEAFVSCGWAPSLVVQQSQAGTVIAEPREQAGILQPKEQTP